MELKYSKNPMFFEIPIKKTYQQDLISGIGIFIASMIGIHRISKGYHSFFDVFVGAIIGSCIGFISWQTIDHYKDLYLRLCEKDKNKKEKECENYNKLEKGENLYYWLKKYNIFKIKNKENKELFSIIAFTRLLLTIPILFLLIKFFTQDIFNLTSIKH